MIAYIYQNKFTLILLLKLIKFGMFFFTVYEFYHLINHIHLSEIESTKHDEVIYRI